MPVKFKVEGLETLINALNKRKKIAEPERPSVAVGFSASYATYVHENLKANHPVGQAKFLETASRENRSQMAAIVAYAMRSKRMTLAEAEFEAGEFLLKRAQ